MCGIAGEYRSDAGRADADRVRGMCLRMQSRGPDASGLLDRGRCVLGHRRLKIIDLSERSAQPMRDERRGLAIVFNGCVYNYRELREELKDAGVRFESDGDTEVVLKAYAAWGPACVERFNGMFAFAIFEEKSGRLFCARDRLGIKPFYYADLPGRFLFASTLPALLRDPAVDRDIDPKALHHYMSFHSVVPAPRTILKGVRKLPPAATLTIDPGGVFRERVYWEPRFEREPGDEKRDFEDWKELVLAQVRRASKRRLVADVPVGVLLSGGLDSSLIVALLAEQGQKGLKTFSIGFETVAEERGDEFQYSDLIAERFGTDHTRLRIDSSGLLGTLPDCVDAMSEPMVSHDAIGFYLLSKEVSRRVKVVQSGQGADEVFAGYRWYPPMLESEDAVADYRAAFFDRDHGEFLRAAHPRFAGEDESLAFLRERFSRPGASTPVDRALRLDTTVMLVEDPVKRVDNMTMAWGLEARVPFLDHELLELAARIPPRHKVPGKKVLAEAARAVVPAEVIDRPKGYFPVPALKFVRGETLAFMRDLVSSENARRRELFSRDYTAELLKDPESHLTPLQGSKLWQLALLELWMDRHVG